MQFTKRASVVVLTQYLEPILCLKVKEKEAPDKVFLVEMVFLLLHLRGGTLAMHDRTRTKVSRVHCSLLLRQHLTMMIVEVVGLADFLVQWAIAPRVVPAPESSIQRK